VLGKDRTAVVRLSATSLDFGLPEALWRAAEDLGVFDLLWSEGDSASFELAGGNVAARSGGRLDFSSSG
jgi:hypothetical protein